MVLDEVTTDYLLVSKALRGVWQKSKGDVSRVYKYLLMILKFFGNRDPHRILNPISLYLPDLINLNLE